MNRKSLALTLLVLALAGPLRAADDVNATREFSIQNDRAFLGG